MIDGRLNCPEHPYRSRPPVTGGLRRYRASKATKQIIELNPRLALVMCFDLFTFTGHLVIPVHKGAVRVIAPGPDVQFEVCRQAVSVRAGNVLERLSLEHRRTIVIREPV